MPNLVLSVYNAVSELPPDAANGTMAWVGSTGQLFAHNGSAWYALSLTLPTAGAVFTTNNFPSDTYSWTVPDRVTSVSILAIGSGAGGGAGSGGASRGTGGGGGGISWINDVAVTPGETLTVTVGRYGAGGLAPSDPPGATGNGTDGHLSKVERSSTVLIQANGGTKGMGDQSANGQGGLGGTDLDASYGGGSAGNGLNPGSNTYDGAGGDVGRWDGTSAGSGANIAGDSTGIYGPSYTTPSWLDADDYGGGGAGGSGMGGRGGQGVVRIIWGIDRNFPSTGVALVDSTDGESTYANAPIITSVTDASAGTSPFTLATDGTPTVITVTASDSDGNPLTYSYAVTSGALGDTATISQADNVFTITPSTSEANAGTFGLTFTANDGVQDATSVADFSLQFTPALSSYRGDRGIIGGRRYWGGSSSTTTAEIKYFDITTTSSTASFGNLNSAYSSNATVSDATSAVFMMTGNNGNSEGYIEYVTIATTGNASYWNGVMSRVYGPSGEFSDGIYGIAPMASYDLEYITFATQGNAAVWGTPVYNTGNSAATGNDPTLALKMGGGSYVPVDIEKYTMQTLGSAADWGFDMSEGNWFNGSGTGDDTYVIAVGGNSSSTVAVNHIHYLTVQTPSASTDFGNLTNARANPKATSNASGRAVMSGGQQGFANPVTYYGNQDYIQIDTPGNATSFGSITTGAYGGATSGAPA